MKNGSILLLIFILSACSSIQRTSQLENAKLFVGSDNKSVVTEKIGLPNKIKRVNGKEYWLYSGNKSGHGVIIVIPIGIEQVSPTTANISYIESTFSSSKNLEENVDLVCV
ncbi:MAG: hypothetical protein P8163_08540 [Candidatus Thiodiazotropha sp.]